MGSLVITDIVLTVMRERSSVQAHGCVLEQAAAGKGEMESNSNSGGGGGNVDMETRPSGVDLQVSVTSEEPGGSRM
jgi:hypothetical protein